MKRGIIRLLIAALAGTLAWVAWLRFRPPPAPPPPVDLTKHDGQTIDFSSGKPVVKDTPQDKALVQAAVKEMEAAAQNVTFGPTPAKPPEPNPPAQPKKP